MPEGEKFRPLESVEPKAERKSRFGERLQKLALAASLLVNGGLLAERGAQKIQLEDSKESESKYSFILQTEEGGGKFNLEKSKEDIYVLSGKMQGKEGLIEVSFKIAPETGFDPQAEAANLQKAGRADEVLASMLSMAYAGEVAAYNNKGERIMGGDYDNLARGKEGMSGTGSSGIFVEPIADSSQK